MDRTFLWNWNFRRRINPTNNVRRIPSGAFQQRNELLLKAFFRAEDAMVRRNWRQFSRPFRACHDGILESGVETPGYSLKMSLRTYSVVTLDPAV